MSKALAAPAFAQGTDAGTHAFLLGQNAAGLWIIRDADGMNAGVFRSREAAIRYVRTECADRKVDIATAPDGQLEFLPAAAGSHYGRAA